jgi:hypothetical protein
LVVDNLGMMVVIFGLDGACDSRHVGGILEFPGLSPGALLPAIVAIYPSACFGYVSDLEVGAKNSECKCVLTVAAHDKFLGTPEAHFLARCRLFRDRHCVVCGCHGVVSLLCSTRCVCRVHPNRVDFNACRLNCTQARQCCPSFSHCSPGGKYDKEQRNSTSHTKWTKAEMTESIQTSPT